MSQPDLSRTDEQGNELPVSYCPECDYEMDAATDVQQGNNARPSPGDVSICLKCTAFLEFDENLHLRTLPLAKLRDLPPEIRDLLHRVRRAVHETMSKKYDEAKVL